jgi:hypothetical protein
MPDRVVSLNHCQHLIPRRYLAPKFQILNLNFPRAASSPVTETPAVAKFYFYVAIATKQQTLSRMGVHYSSILKQ